MLYVANHLKKRAKTFEEPANVVVVARKKCVCVE